MTKAAFEKIKAGLEEAKAYLDALAEKRNDKPQKTKRRRKRNSTVSA